MSSGVHGGEFDIRMADMPLGQEPRLSGMSPLAAALESLAAPAFLEVRGLLACGNLDTAAARLDAMLMAEPANPVLQYLRADIDLCRDAYGRAGQRLRICLEQAPGYLAALHGLGYALFRQFRLAEAATEAMRLLALDPVNFPGRLLRAAIASVAGQHGMAAMLYRGILGERPDHIPSILALGHCLRMQGDAEGAIAAYRRALECNPTCCEAWSCLASMKTYGFSPADISAMENLAGRVAVPEPERLFVHFALGKAYFDHQDDARSFKHYAQGKAIARAIAPRDRVTQDEWAAWIGRAATDALGSDSPAGGVIDGSNVKDVPIFIVGMPRAGSTLVEQIIGSHSRVEATSELPYFDLIARRIIENGSDLRSLDREALAEEYLSAARVHRMTDRPWFIDKLPANWRHVGLIRTVLPQARIVDVRRHPMASCVAIFRQHFLGGGELAGSLTDIANTWRNYAALMRRIEAAWPDAVYRVRYEDLVTDTEAEVRSLLAALDLPFEDACLRWFENGQPVRTPSSEQVRRPIFRRGLDEWRRFEPWLAEAGILLSEEVARWDQM
jgi:tetratricopeptide (TPR) repeat protein